MQRRLGWLCFFGILIAVASPVESAVAPKPNIVLVTLDSVRADRVGILGARSRLTPNLDALARQAIIFERAYAQAPDTVASTATILTGTYPQTHRASGFGGPLAASLPYLPDLLRAAGYRTAAVAGSILVDPYEGPFQGYDRGFNDYVAGFHLPQEGQGRYQSVALRGDQVIARAIAWLTKAKGRSFFLWLNLPDAGTPGASYDRAVAASDLSLGRL
ncbi:MAG TPA: sulfatase-like hydrolase/transferase, partial [Terriglobales bacterium]|nr:sulfatase-like hydrolase/transferase [Terriglobales bacterium]